MKLLYFFFHDHVFKCVGVLSDVVCHCFLFKFFLCTGLGLGDPFSYPPGGGSPPGGLSGLFPGTDLTPQVPYSNVREYFLADFSHLVDFARVYPRRFRSPERANLNNKVHILALFQMVHNNMSIRYCAADFSLFNLPKGKSLGRSKPATSSYAQAPQHTVWDDFFYIQALLNCLL